MATVALAPLICTGIKENKEAKQANLMTLGIAYLLAAIYLYLRGI